MEEVKEPEFLGKIPNKFSLVLVTLGVLALYFSLSTFFKQQPTTDRTFLIVLGILFVSGIILLGYGLKLLREEYIEEKEYISLKRVVENAKHQKILEAYTPKKENDSNNSQNPSKPEKDLK